MGAHKHQFGDAEYMVSRKQGTVYSVVKFEGGDEPVDQFEVTYYPERVNCSCRGFRWKPTREHKHVQLVDKFIEIHGQAVKEGRPLALITLWFAPTAEDPDNIDYREFGNVLDRL